MINKKIMGSNKADGVTLMLVKRTMKWIMDIEEKRGLMDCHNYMKCVFVQNFH